MLPAQVTLPPITGGAAAPSQAESYTSISIGSSFAVGGSGGGATAVSPEGPALSELAELGQASGGVPWLWLVLLAGGTLVAALLLLPRGG